MHISYNILKAMDAPHHPTTDKKVAATYKKKTVIVKVHEFVWYICWVIEITLIIRTALKLLGANPESAFVSFVYDFSNIFAYPFLKMFPSTIIGRTEFEWSIFFAMVIFAIVAWLVVTLIRMAKPESQEEIDERL